MLALSRRLTHAAGNPLVVQLGRVLLSLVFVLFLLSPTMVYVYANTQARSEELTVEQHIANAKRVVRVHTTAELVAAIKAVIPGDVVVLADGTYSGEATLTIFNQRATAEQPIVIIAQNQGRAVLAGTLHFELSYSSYVTISGLVFDNKGSGPRKDVGAIILKHSHHNRITRNHFALREQRGAQPEVMLDWVVIRGGQSKYNRIDHNLFENKLQRGRFVIVGVLSATDTMPQYTRIDHNHFRDMVPLGINGMEAVVLGGGHPQSSHYLEDQDAFSVFEYNLMERVDGECAEIISLKSSANEIRYNTILDTHGSIYFRTGNRNAVYGNYIIGFNKPGSGGVRVYGADQTVMHNYFSQLDLPAVWFGDANAPFFNPQTDLAPFTQVVGAAVGFNTFVDTNLALARHLREASPYTPKESTISHNLIYSSQNHTLLDLALLAIEGIQWQGNWAYAVHGDRDTQLSGQGLDEAAVRWADPQMQQTGFYPNYLYSLSPESPAQQGVHDAAGAVDIEGKPRGETTSVGSFAHTGHPPLRGLLTAEDVGPWAFAELGPLKLGEHDLVLTGLSLVGEQGSDGSWYGPVQLQVQTAARGLTQPITYQVLVDGHALAPTTSATYTLNNGELHDGLHQVWVQVQSGALLDEAQIEFTISNTRVLSPTANAVVQGKLPVQITTSFTPELIKHVQLSIDGEVVYQDALVPHELQLPTQHLADSMHTLQVQMVSESGATTNATVKFRTANFWHQEITFTQPQQSWFFAGSTENTQMTAGWSYADMTSEALFGDPSRLVRSSSTTESCTWTTPQIKAAIITLYARTEQVTQEIVLAVSTDGEHWQQVPYTVQTVAQNNSGWYELQLATGTLKGVHQYLRLTVLAGDIPSADLQLGHAQLQGLN